MLEQQPLILIIDDELNNLFLLQELLQSEGYQTQTATSGDEGLELARGLKPDLILLDIMMPEMDGYEVCRLFREDQQLQTIPVIFLTALDDDQSRIKGLETMGDDYLTKPIKADLLVTKIASLFKLQKMRSQAHQIEVKRQVQAQAKQQLSVAWEINEYLSEKFRLFVPEQYLQRIAPRGVESIQLGNSTEEELTILFCDIRGFTSITEFQAAQKTFEWLNAFFTEMNQAIVEHWGFIDKYLGDAIMAVFDRKVLHGIDAVQAAIAMQKRLQSFNENYRHYELENPVEIGIGIHTGVGIIGTLGADRRMDSTVIGDVVNTAARIENLTKFYGCPIIASQATIEQVEKALILVKDNYLFEGNLPLSSLIPLAKLEIHAVLYRWIDQVLPRGKQQVVELYELLGTEGDLLDETKVRSQSYFAQGIQAWREGNLTTGWQYFQQILEQNPDDRIAQLYLERCTEKLGASCAIP